MVTEARIYTQKEVNLIFDDVPAKTLLYWARHGLIEWAGEKNDGRGIVREYNLWHLYQIAVVRELAEMGLSYITINFVMGNFFKGYLFENDRVRNVQQGHELVSLDKYVDRFLILEKYKSGRGWTQKTNQGEMQAVGVTMVKKSDIGEFMKESKAVGYDILNLHEITYRTNYRIEELGLE